jgi:hypothetical protein
MTAIFLRKRDEVEANHGGFFSRTDYYFISRIL